MLGVQDEVEAEQDLPASEGEVERSALETFLGGAPAPDAAGVRVVHGGNEFHASTVVDGDMLSRLADTADLAPLHNPPALLALRVVREVRPDLPLVACFDTAFHSTIPDSAAVYAVPWQWTTDWGLRRYGFHGLSHAYASRRAASLLGRPASELRLVTCHLGAGASLCAVQGGTSVDTTMGFTPMEGLVMATRSGSVDPGIVLWVQRRRGMSAEAVERALDRDAGLAGISGVSADMRQVLAAADQGNQRAQLALDVYVHRLRGFIATMAAAMGGLDGLVFTGGVGERSAAVRAAASGGLGFVGVSLDQERNRSVAGDAVIGAPNAPCQVVVVEAREDLEIAREVRRLSGGAEAQI